MFTSKFDHHDGQPDREQVELWAEKCFGSIYNLLNGFFCKVDVAEVLCRMELVPFDELVCAQLEGESQVVIDIATAKVQELTELELDCLRAYAD